MQPMVRDIMAGFHRVNRCPLDDSCVIDYSNFFHYLKNGTAYSGQYLTIDYGIYLQPVVLIDMNDGNLIAKPLRDGPDELIFKNYNGSHYLQIYNYIMGHPFNTNFPLKTDNPRMYSILLLANLYANEQNDISWLLEKNGDLISFIQPNFTLQRVGPSEGLSGFRIYSFSNSLGHYATSDLTLSIMPSRETTDKVKLYVLADDYYEYVHGGDSI